MFNFLTFLWFIRTTKSIFFWLYLWQLKEYHTGRFLDHFRTEKGKQLFFNLNFGFKVILIPVFFSYPLFVFFTLFFIYLAESAKAILDILLKELKAPVLTQKTALLILAGLLVEVLAVLAIFTYAENILELSFWLLIADVLAPIFTSLIVLIFQPLAVLGRNQIIKRAKIKRAQFSSSARQKESYGGSTVASGGGGKNLLVIGITGSYGKTSTKEFLYTILSGKFKVLKTREHQNSEMGISQCILNDLKPEHEIFIVEMGAYNRGGIKLLCDIVRPKIGIITGVNEQHLATFGSMENLLSAEGGGELIESLPRSEQQVLLRGLPIDTMAFFNGKNRYCVELYEKTLRRGLRRAFLYGQNVELQGLENIEGAKMVAKELGMTDGEIERAVAKIENKFPGITIKNGVNGLKIIDATYSANPDSIIAHLEYAKTLPGKKILVMPCLIELGSSSKEVHRRIGKKIGEVCDLAIITTKDKFKEIKEEAGGKAVFMDNPNDIYKKIRNFCLSPEALAKEEKNKCTVLLESRVPSKLISLVV